MQPNNVARDQFKQHFTPSIYACRSQRRKKYSQAISLLESARLKYARKMLVKSNPEGFSKQTTFFNDYLRPY